MLRYITFLLIFFIGNLESLFAADAKGTTAASTKPAGQIKVLCLGDSLTEGYGVPRPESYPSQLQKLLVEKGYQQVEVVNGGISGSTTASSLRRLQWHLKGKKKPDIIILALGANDGLRGQDVKNSQDNLEKTIELAQNNNIKILLAGMKMPPNYGNKYTREFEQIFPAMAKKHKLPIIPFLLEGVAANKELNLPDGIHPNAKGYEIVTANVFKHLKPLLEKP